MDFTKWLHDTRLLQREAFGKVPEGMVGDERADWLMMNLFAINTEVTEIADEVGWKPWTQPRGWVNRDNVINEVVDVMHFLANILITVEEDDTQLGIELSERYLAKMAKNRIRQKRGDDGISRRCEGCKRSLDDVGVHAVDLGQGKAPIVVCNECGYQVPEELTNG